MGCNIEFQKLDNKCLESCGGARQMAQQLRAQATLSKDLSSALSIGSSQVSITPVPGDSMPSDLYRQQYAHCAQTSRGTTSIDTKQYKQNKNHLTVRLWDSSVVESACCSYGGPEFSP